jgi:catechol 2,3-dioxygenase-like lactoylglutathione lyase family enzyme
MLCYLGYVVLFAEDLDSLVKFYAETVGLSVRLRADGYVELAVEGARLALLSRTRLAAHMGDTHAGRPAAGSHEGLVTILVEDVDRVHRELAGRGVAFLGTPQDRPWGQRTVCFQDPEGHIVELATNRPRPERTGV